MNTLPKSVTGSACSYNNLGNYQGANNTMPPVRAGVSSGVYLTPNYSAIGYNAFNTWSTTWMF